MNSVEDYARKWAKQEEVEHDTHSDWVTSIRSLIRKRIFKFSRFMSSKATSIFNDKDVVDNLTDLYDKYVDVPADKASNNIVFVCKIYYTDCLVKELGINKNMGNPTYTPTSLSNEILSDHKSVISLFGLSVKNEYVDLPYLYWIPKLYRCPYKERYIAGSVKCSTKSLSKLLTTVLSTVKDGLYRLTVIPPINVIALTRCAFSKLLKIL